MTEPKKTFLHFMAPASLLYAVDEWRFRNRQSSRAAAIIWLLEFALKQKPKVG